MTRVPHTRRPQALEGKDVGARASRDWEKIKNFKYFLENALKLKMVEISKKFRMRRLSTPQAITDFYY